VKFLNKNSHYDRTATTTKNIATWLLQPLQYVHYDLCDTTAMTITTWPLQPLWPPRTLWHDCYDCYEKNDRYECVVSLFTPGPHSSGTNYVNVLLLMVKNLLLASAPYSSSILLLLTLAPNSCFLLLLLAPPPYSFFLLLFLTHAPYSCSLLFLLSLVSYSCSLLLLFTPAPCSVNLRVYFAM